MLNTDRDDRLLVILPKTLRRRVERAARINMVSRSSFLRTAALKAVTELGIPEIPDDAASKTPEPV